MADQLADTADLASLLESDLDLYKATMLVECATAVVQEAAGGQRLVAVSGDTATLIGTTDQWLDLPQRPVTSVTSVTLDGTALVAGTDADEYKLFGSRLWRTDGWQTYYGQPSEVVIVHDHGYATGSQNLQLARSSVLSLLRSVYGNPEGLTRVQIDDYAEAYSALSTAMEASSGLRAAIRRQYGRRAGLVRLG
jgi:hypothetical protein